MGKKIVDLIYIEPEKDNKTRIDDIVAKIDYWNDNLKIQQETYFERSSDPDSQALQEFLSMRKFLKKFLYQRAVWIQKTVEDPELKREYLKVLPPFNQKGGIKSLLLHFYQVKESPDGKGLMYQVQNNEDKELRILWDIYKLRKTIESIDTINRSLQRPPHFPSIFPEVERIRCLNSLRSVFHLLFQMCIQKKYQKELYTELSGRYMKPEAILKRSEMKVNYVYPHVIEKFNYRNHFFYAYFYSGMRAKIGREIREFRYNYLDFEIIKQEFLINWLNQKLKENPRKREIYQKYAIGGKTLAEILIENPGKEIYLLKQLPLHVFNDITAEVNQKVEASLKTKVNSLSENYGEPAEVKRNFDFAHRLVQSSIHKLKSFLSNPVQESLQPNPEPPAEEPPSQKREKPKFDIQKVKKNQISYPYFHTEIGTYKQKLALLRIKMGNTFAAFNSRLNKFLGNVNESFVISRRTPKFEWSMPYYIKETYSDDEKHHLLILGAEVKAKQLSMGYSKKLGRNTHIFTCFFVYACNEMNQSMGNVIGKRVAKGIEFNEYDFANGEVQKKMLQLFDMVLEKEGF